MRHPAARALAAPLAAVALVALLLTGAAPAFAHDGTSGTIAVRVDGQRVVGTAPVFFVELGLEDTSGDGLVDAEELRAQQRALAGTLVASVRDRVRLQVDGQDLTIVGAGLAYRDAAHDASPWVEVAFLTEPHDGDVSRLDLQSSFTQYPGTQVLLTSADGVVTGRLGEGGSTTFSLDAAATLGSSFALGVDRIRSGADHLMFLMVLVLAVVPSTPTRASRKRVALLLTAFTVGHAISLALAWFDVISVPAALWGTGIALSIVAAAALAVPARSGRAKPWTAGGLGLVHGLGFASSLEGLGVASAQRIPALAAFHVGVDVAQTVVVLSATSALWAVTKALPARGVRWVRVIVCGAAGAVGLFWAIARALS